MNTATAQHTIPEVRLSREAESKVVFWTAPDSAVHSEDVIAAVLGVAVNTLSNWRVAGEGPVYVKRGRKVYYSGRDVRAWLGSQP